MIKLARSADGVKFESTGQVFATNAHRPDVITLANGDLLATFESSGELWASRSKDEGKSWTPPRQITVRGLGDGERIASPKLLLMPSGAVRMYYLLTQDKNRKRARTEAIIGSAITRNGVDYQVDRQVLVACPDMQNCRISAFWAEKKLFLLIRASQADPDSGRVQQFISRDGRSFGRPDRARFAGQIGPVLQVDKHHWRMYVASGDQVGSRISSDGQRWRDDPEPCLSAGLDAAVAAIGKQSYLMLFCTKPDSPDAQSNPLVSVGQPSAPTDSKQPENQPGWGPFTNSTEGLTSDADAPGENGQLPPLQFAPIPDFVNRFDYIGWFEQNLLISNDQNAYFAYGPMNDDAMNAPEGTFQDMYNGGKYKGPPGPWLPDDHPDWEASYQATQNFVSLFRAGSADPNPFRSPLACASDATGEECLVSAAPKLGGFRRVARAVLSQAWRTENGQVSPENMRSAFDTCLANANQLQQGNALLERLVAAYERKIVQENARWALKRNVFSSPDELQSVLDTLRQKDLPAEDPAGWVAMEQAWAMNLAQYVMVPQGPTGESAVNPERLKKAVQLIQGDENPQIPEDVLRASKEDALNFAEEVTNYYQKVEQAWRASQGGPLVEGTDRLAEEINERNPVAGGLLASGDRAYELILRTESGAKATQLVYSVELFRIRNGRYPASLEELPAEEVGDARTDPYNGGTFAYRLTDNGPMIYSISRNGRDDGGTHYASWGDQNDPNASDDYVFWPPQE